MAVAIIMARRRLDEVNKEVDTIKAWIIIAKKKGEKRLTIHGHVSFDSINILHAEYNIQYWNEYTQDGEFIRRTNRIFWK